MSFNALFSIGGTDLAMRCSECAGQGNRAATNTEAEDAQVKSWLAFETEWPQVKCTACDGTGGALTPQGDSLLEFVRRFSA